MSTNPFQTMEATFGWSEFPDAMFYHSAFGLRFELGGDIDSVPIRLIRALERAKAVVAELFLTSSTLTAVVSIYGEERATRRHSASMQQLKRIGFPHSFGPATKIPQNDEDHIAEFGGDLFRHWYAVQFTNDEASISALLWASVSREMAIQPKVRWVDTIHIADFQKRLALTAYDDRGMDVVGPSAPALSTLYQKFNPWLLDYDRAEMDAKFSS